jgi:hypothetical protein
MSKPLSDAANKHDLMVEPSELPIERRRLG